MCHQLELLSSLFKLPGVKVFLSGMISQDPVEKHFGMLRQKGKSNDNPTVMECIKNAETLRIVCNLWLNDKSGNCRGSHMRRIAETKELPLRKRQQRSSL